MLADAVPAAYAPNAALVNYYGSEGDRLCGHQVRSVNLLRLLY